jgi:exodeoxyribonuclease VII small subunit
MTKRKTKEPLFEKSLNELEALVEEMEKGNLDLEASLQHFERGIQLTRACHASECGAKSSSVVGAK